VVVSYDRASRNGWADRQWFWGELLAHFIRIPWTRTYLDLFDLIFRRERYIQKFVTG